MSTLLALIHTQNERRFAWDTYPQQASDCPIYLLRKLVKNSAMNYCSQCGAKVPSIAKFCSACGAPTTNLIEKDADALLISEKEMITQSATSTDSQASRTICLHKNKVVKSNGVTFCEDCGESNEQHSNPHSKEFKEPSLSTKPLTFISISIIIAILIALIGQVHTSSQSIVASTVESDNSSISKLLPTDTLTQKPALEPGTIGWYLKQPAQQYIAPGPAMQNLTQRMGINLNNGERPITVEEMADQIYAATGQLAGKVLTKNDIDIGLQPGNGLYTFLAGLLNGPESYQAIVYELLLDGSKNS